MSERARALEQALNRAIDRTIIAHGDEVFISEGYSGRESLLAYFAQEVAAVATPPSGASPQAEPHANVRALTVHICDDCLNLRGEMCNEPGCRFCRRTMAEVAEYLDVLLIRPRIDGVSVLVDEGALLTNCRRSDV